MIVVPIILALLLIYFLLCPTPSENYRELREIEKAQARMGFNAWGKAVQAKRDLHSRKGKR